MWLNVVMMMEKGIIMAVSVLLLCPVIWFIDPHAGHGAPYSKSPARIVSLSPPITEWLYVLGLEEAIVGVTTYCQKPPKASEKTKVGSVVEANVEKIVRLKPDLVLAMSLTNTKDIKKLKDIGVNVVTFEIPKTFAQLCDVFFQIGKIAGREDKTLKILKESRKRVSDITRKINNLPKQKVLIQIGSKPFFVATSDFFVNDYIELAGGVNLFRDAKSGAVNREEAVRRNPDVIIIAEMGISGDNERNRWKRFASIDAVKENRIHIIDPYICSPTPVSFAESLEEIAHILRP